MFLFLRFLASNREREIQNSNFARSVLLQLQAFFVDWIEKMGTVISDFIIVTLRESLLEFALHLLVIDRSIYSTALPKEQI